MTRLLLLGQPVSPPVEQNIFEGGTNGVDITTANSGGFSGDAFDVVSLGSGVSLPTARYTTAQKAHGAVGAEIVHLSTSDEAYVGYTFAARDEAYARMYYRHGGVPSQAFKLIAFQYASGVSGTSAWSVAGLNVTTTGTLRPQGNAGSNLGTASSALTTGQWYRVELHAVRSTGVLQARVWTGATLESKSEADCVYTQDLTAQDLGTTNINGVRFGMAANVVAFTSTYTFQIDDVGWGTNWLGPNTTTSISLSDQGIAHLDDEYGTAAGAGQSNSLFGGSGTREKLGQTFSGVTGTLQQVTLDLSRQSTSPTDSVTLEVRSDSTGAPGALLASSTLNSSSLPDADVPGWEVVFVLDGSVSLSAATTYWLVLTRSVRSTVNFIDWSRRSDAYAGGFRYLQESGVWTQQPTQDFRFKLDGDTLDVTFIPGQTLFNRTASDTATSISDSLPIKVTRGLADTASTVSESLLRTSVRPIATTASTISDALARTVRPLLADTATSITETLRPTTTRPIADTALSQSDALARRPIRPIADTATSVSDAITRAIARPLADTGVSHADALALLVKRPIADTATTTSDSLRTAAGRAISDTATSISDQLVRYPGRALSDTAVTISDSMLRSITRNIADTGASVSDSLRPTIVRNLAYTLTISDALSPTVLYLRTLADTATSVSDQIARTAFVTAADTATSVSDSLVRGSVTRTLSDSAASITDAITARTTRLLSDTVSTISDALNAVQGRRASDTATAISDVIVTSRSHRLADTAVNVSDAIVTTAGVKVADTAMSISDSLAAQLRFVRTIADPASSISDAMRRSILRNIATTAVSMSDDLKLQFVRLVSDTAVTISDEISRGFAVYIYDDMRGPGGGGGPAEHSVSITDIAVQMSDHIAGPEAPPAPEPPPGYPGVFTPSQPRPPEKPREKQKYEYTMVDRGSQVADVLVASHAMERAVEERVEFVERTVVSASDIGMQIGDVLDVTPIIVQKDDDDESDALMALSLL